MGTVYVVNKSASVDFSEAKKYGDVKYITDGYIKYDNLRKLSTQLNDALIDSKETDFLVLAGNNLLCVIVTQLWMKLHGRINILHWETRSSAYTIIPVTVDQIPVII